MAFRRVADGVELKLAGTTVRSTADSMIELNVNCRGGLGCANCAIAAIATTALATSIAPPST